MTSKPIHRFFLSPSKKIYKLLPLKHCHFFYYFEHTTQTSQTQQMSSQKMCLSSMTCHVSVQSLMRVYKSFVFSLLFLMLFNRKHPIFIHHTKNETIILSFKRFFFVERRGKNVSLICQLNNFSTFHFVRFFLHTFFSL